MTDSVDDFFKAASLAFVKKFDGILHINIGETGEIWVDGRTKTPRIMRTPPDDVPIPDATNANTKNNREPFDMNGLCIWHATPDILHRIFDGDRALTSAYISGRLAIQGDMSVMARLSMETSTY